MSVNKVILIGRLGQDPEVKHTPSGATVCNFSLATSEYFSDRNGQRQERTEWHRIVVWGKTADNCGQYIRKGSQVFIEGRLQTRSWDDQNGQKRYATEVIANTVQFLDSAGASRQAAPNNNYQQNSNYAGQAPMQQQAQPMQEEPSFDIHADANYKADDIPF